jgi:NAD(P)-dependent dehydrogenase (short-subunit alcohol dehydrogenase family)
MMELDGALPIDLGLHGSRALITGGSRGIGFAVADALAAEGAVVGLIARDANDRAADVQHRARQAHLATAVADVTNTRALNCVVDQIGAALGVLDGHWWPTRAAWSAAET